MAITKKVKKKKCKVCKEYFLPYNTTQPVCSGKCAIVKVRIDNKKSERKADNEIRRSLLTHNDYIKLCQAVFNTFIRLRDRNRPCVSCNRPIKDKCDAGHFIPTTYSFVRFNEDNVHRQCVHCNQHKRGNVIEYRIRLVQRIGEDKVLKLEEIRHNTMKLSIPEIQDMIEDYREKVKEIKNIIKRDNEV